MGMFAAFRCFIEQIINGMFHTNSQITAERNIFPNLSQTGLYSHFFNFFFQNPQNNEKASVTGSETVVESALRRFIDFTFT